MLKRLSCVMLLLVIGSTNFSCKKIDDEKSTRLATEETNWKKLEDARANLLSVYGLMRSAVVSDNTHWLMGDLRQGDFKATQRADLKAIINGDLNAQFPVIDRMTNWRRFYAAINAASLFIERSSEILANDKRYNKITNDVEIAQARMVRAFAYFYMVRIWGDVPLLTSSHDGNEQTLPRTSQDKVLAFCSNELLAAAKVLPYRYGVTDADETIFPGLYYGGDWPSWNGITWTRLSAYIILAHIAAWQGNYVDCANYAGFVVDNYSRSSGGGSYGVGYIGIDELTENDYNSPFAFKRATLLVGFPFEEGTGLATANGHIEQLTLARPWMQKEHPEIYVPKDIVLKLFTDEKDLRFSINPATGLYRTNYFTNFEATEQPVFSKIKCQIKGLSNTNFALFTSSAVFSRLEEITLLLAEALAVTGKRSDAIIALDAASKLRGISYKDTDDLIDAIFAERRRELMGEGWRWYDLVRYNKIKKNNPDFMKLIAEKGIYWPISRTVLSANPLIQQNTYWH